MARYIGQDRWDWKEKERKVGRRYEGGLIKEDGGKASRGREREEVGGKGRVVWRERTGNGGMR